MPIKSTKSTATAQKTTAVKKTVKRTTKTKAASARTAKAKPISSAGKTLIVVESPTKAKTLTKILGSKYVVKASVGHIVDLPKSRLAIDIENNFTPEYILVKGKAAIKKELQTAAQCADKVLLAADPDREGEAIAWHVAELLGVDPADDCRIRFHEITADAVKTAVKEPGPIDMNRVDAQQARRVLDRLVGYTLSPLLWKKIRRGLSAGRVQSVALAILCAREKEIEDFVPKDYWNIYVDASSEDGRKYRLHVEKEKDVSLISEGKTLAIDTPAKVKRIEKTLNSSPLIVSSFLAKSNARKQPLPFKTSTLQQIAASKLGFSPRRTMGIAQSLFEGVSVPGHGTVGLITYMRTDSLRMAPEAIKQVRSVIHDTWGKKYLPAKAVVYQAGANAQDAHEAIR
ncbi:MAG: type I DNA topoisomerase, partial [Pyramidobacter sp.]|nr:type I DNA topoisomerase [Pyramidobacter sp.]